MFIYIVSLGRALFTACCLRRHLHGGGGTSSINERPSTPLVSREAPPQHVNSFTHAQEPSASNARPWYDLGSSDFSQGGVSGHVLLVLQWDIISVECSMCVLIIFTNSQSEYSPEDPGAWRQIEFNKLVYSFLMNGNESHSMQMGVVWSFSKLFVIQGCWVCVLNNVWVLVLWKSNVFFCWSKQKHVSC